MTNQRIASKQERLEVIISDMITAALAMRAPIVWCISFAVVINSLCLMVPSWRDRFWAPPVIGVCGLIWMIVVSCVFRFAFFKGFNLRELVHLLGFTKSPAGTLFFTAPSVWMPFIGIVFSAFPGPIGATLSAAVLLGAVMFVSKGQDGLKILGIILVCFGAALLILSFFEVNSVYLGCGALAIVSLFAVAVGASSSGVALKKVLRIESVCSVTALLLAIPLAVVGETPNVLVPALFVCTVVLPAGSMLFFYFLQKNSIGRFRRITANLRASLESTKDLARCEDEVRESDGYFRVCEPRYSHLKADSVGETGYITWPEHDGLVFPNSDGEWCLARATSSLRNPILTECDLRGMDLRKAFELCAKTVTSMVADSNLDAFLSRAFKHWHLRTFRGQDEHEYFKMPWDSGEVLAIPRIFSCSFVYPPGSGILDISGLPCEARSVRVQITLRPEVVTEFQNGGIEKGTLNGDSLSRALVWHSPLVIPSAYEGVLRILVSEMKKWNSLSGIDQTALQVAMSARARECFSEELNNLIILQITSVDVAQSAVQEKDREIHRMVNEFRVTLPGKKTSEVRGLEELVRRAVYMHNEFILKAKVYSAIHEIEKKLNEGIKEFDEAVASGMISVGRDGVETSIVGEGVEVARTLVQSHVRDLRKALTDQQDRLIKSFNRIDQAFSRKT
jgi:hypothetical protein